jgi:hypothetical protein
MANANANAKLDRYVHSYIISKRNIISLTRSKQVISFFLRIF